MLNVLLTTIIITGSTWGDCADYDMIINVGRCGIDKAVELIANYIK